MSRIPMDYRFFDDAMELAGAMHRLVNVTSKLTGTAPTYIIVDAQHPPFSTYELHPGLLRQMWCWGTFSGISIWSEA